MHALILIDIQDGFDDPKWGARNHLGAEENASRLLDYFRGTQRCVIHIKHDSTNPTSPLHPDSAGNRIKAVVRPLPGESVMVKSVNSAFIGTTLEHELRAKQVSHLVIAGLTTPHCVSTTARMAANLGFGVTVGEDATAAFDWVAHDGRTVAAELMHYYALASLSGEFASIRSTSDIVKGAV